MTDEQMREATKLRKAAEVSNVICIALGDYLRKEHLFETEDFKELFKKNNHEGEHDNQAVEILAKEAVRLDREDERDAMDLKMENRHLLNG